MIVKWAITRSEEEAEEGGGGKEEEEEDEEEEEEEEVNINLSCIQVAKVKHELSVEYVH
jgi:hypothetical protein